MKYVDNFRFSSTAFSRFLTTIRENKSGSNQKSLITGTNAMHWLEARLSLLLKQKWQFSHQEFIRRFKLSENNFPGMLLGVVLTFVLVRHALYPLKNTRVWKTYFQISLLILSFGILISALTPDFTQVVITCSALNAIRIFAGTACRWALTQITCLRGRCKLV